METLQGRRVRLRPTTHADLGFLQIPWNDGQVMRYVGYPQSLGIDERGVREWFTRLGRHRGLDREHWIVENEHGEPIGEAYYKAERECCGYRAQRMAQVDLKLARRFWGRSYASYALRTFIRYFFEQGFEVIAVSPNLANEAALKLYRHLGFQPKNRFWAEETGAEHQVWVLRKR